MDGKVSQEGGTGMDETRIGEAEASQLRRYAEDLNLIYKSEIEKRAELEKANSQLEEANRQLVRFAEDLGATISQLRETHEELREAYIDTIHRLVLAAEFKDEDTGDHIMRMARYSALMAEKIGFTTKEIEMLLYSAPMHDVGKVGIPDRILLKPGKLTGEEFELMKSHAIIGARILANSRSEMLKTAQQIALTHHEKWNGAGYPMGHKEEEIPIVGRIVGIADVFDALTSRRPYKDPYPLDVSLEIIKKGRGQDFDPHLVDIFLNNIDTIVAIKAEINSSATFQTQKFSYSERDKE
jgi:putative two-component system response regulator